MRSTLVAFMSEALPIWISWPPSGPTVRIMTGDPAMANSVRTAGSFLENRLSSRCCRDMPAPNSTDPSNVKPESLPQAFAPPIALKWAATTALTVVPLGALLRGMRICPNASYWSMPPLASKGSSKSRMSGEPTTQMLRLLGLIMFLATRWMSSTVTASMRCK